MIKADKVMEILLAFIQNTIIGELVLEEYDFSSRRVVLERFSKRKPLTITEVHFWSATSKMVLRATLSEHITFLMMMNHLEFPDDFLTECSDYQLGAEMLAYIAENPSPFE